MEKVYTSVSELVGHTPLIRLQKMEECAKTAGAIYAKLESFSPGGSAKDRIALAMLLEAERTGRLLPGGTVIEPTSGNTGIGLACMGAARGYRVILVMPDSMSRERQLLMAAYGAQIELTPGRLGMQGAVDRARELVQQIPGSFLPDQFGNPENPAIHEKTTGPEIWEALQGKVDVFVAGIGTGGTVTGVGRFLKGKSPSVQIVGVEPAGSPLLTAGKAGSHGIMGIGANFVPDILDRSVLHEVLTVTEEQAYQAARTLARTEGILAGISSGAALHGALQIAQRAENKDKNIVVFLPDSGERYLSTALF